MLPITARIDPQAGFKVYPTIIAMVVLAVPPIMVNTYSGLAGVDRDILEAGRGQGMSERQILRRRGAAPGRAGHRVPVSAPRRSRSWPRQRLVPCSASAGWAATWSTAWLRQNEHGQIFGGVVLVAGLVIVTELCFAIGSIS